MTAASLGLLNEAADERRIGVKPARNRRGPSFSMGFMNDDLLDAKTHDLGPAPRVRNHACCSNSGVTSALSAFKSALRHHDLGSIAMHGARAIVLTASRASS